MSLKQKITADLLTAMKAGDNLKRDVLRMLEAMIKNTEIEKLKKEEGLIDSEVQEVIGRAVKQRKDAAAQYAAGNRPELAEKENQEIEILLTYLPRQFDETEVREVVEETIVQAGATSASEIGKVMGLAMKKLKGLADGNLVKKIAEEKLR
ncbi:MAG: aspartyl-tRNA amidotransferase [Candidatus Moranbacteria bacterium CG06_land_8_20_14_3_00_40_12]|nr:MAG: aspartyl-tRNA amidotransferase [Candidatus Moranbacteria bacterium CG23_combo_of_CG06-09_8_20_14_all_40_16]PIU80968.1 MAG: aspartyl-tRNA amidotransferase [Candidatus Moranbacteria bacterium CG06_land_8_20_14_3_00_40_12]